MTSSLVSQRFVARCDERYKMLVSVIIATYNYGKYLRESIASALYQTVPPDEIIVVDDGSTDETSEIVRPFLSRSRVRYLRTDNRGVSNARNLGIQHSTGEIIAFLDADDVWRRDKLELQLPLFSDPTVGVVYSLQEMFDENGTVSHRHAKVFRGDVLRALMTHNIVCFSSAMVRRGCLDRVGIFDERYAPSEDYDLWLRIAAEGYAFDYIDKPLVRRRVGHVSASDSVQTRRESLRRLHHHFFRDPKYRQRVTPRMKRLAWGASFSKEGCWHYEQGRRMHSLYVYLRALWHDPSLAMAWRGVAKCVLPRALVAELRCRVEPTEDGWASPKHDQ